MHFFYISRFPPHWKPSLCFCWKSCKHFPTTSLFSLRASRHVRVVSINKTRLEPLSHEGQTLVRDTLGTRLSGDRRVIMIALSGCSFQPPLSPRLTSATLAIAMQVGFHLRFPLYAFVHGGWVVRKWVNANPELKVNRSTTFSCIKNVFHTAYVLCLTRNIQCVSLLRMRQSVIRCTMYTNTELWKLHLLFLGSRNSATPDTKNH